MQAALSTLLRLLAPYLPFVTDEAWSWWHAGSVHQAEWPRAEALTAMAAGGAPVDGVLQAAVEVLTAVRRAKSEAKVGMKTAIERAEVRDIPARLAAIEQARADVAAAGNIQSLVLTTAEAFEVAVVFAAPVPGAPA
jgi:valyl-tRNA synthetase